jgi:cold-inducible RNA-binding protein
MKKLYVGNLPYDYDDRMLMELFAQFNPVSSATVIMDRATNRSKGFGFVELEDDMADKAILALNNKEVNGRPLKINEARPMEDRKSSFGGNNRYRR